MNEKRLFYKTIIDECFKCPELIDIVGNEYHEDFRCRFLYNDESTRHLSTPRDLLWIIDDCPLPKVN